MFRLDLAFEPATMCTYPYFSTYPVDYLYSSYTLKWLAKAYVIYMYHKNVYVQVWNLQVPLGIRELELGFCIINTVHLEYYFSLD